ncbi:MAG: MFS superfamily sulfate permease-like transporter [Luteibaculaceae bacterium]|jgi:MFS superfamily sulfate permease-like transporter
MSNKYFSGRIEGLSFKSLDKDIPASIVVFLVAVPLCLGIALASGAPPISGLIAGIVGGALVTLVSRSSLGVSGPAAGLAVIVLSAIETLGSFELFLTAVIMCGVFQIIFGIVKAGIIGYYFPSSVIKGMLSGIGIIIFLKQIPHAFGYDKDPSGEMSFIQPDGNNTFSELWHMFDAITPLALFITVVSLLILILWDSPKIKSRSWSRLVPGPLVVVLFGILAQIFSPAEWQLIPEHLVVIPTFNGISEFASNLQTPDFSGFTNPEIYKVGAIMAVVASLETLLCVEATDKLDPWKRITPANQELVAQGLGNVVSGFFGGLPITQVIVRSSANIQSGGKTRMAAFLHGVLVLASVLFIPFILNLIPFASLAAILLTVGYKLAKPSLFKEMYQKGLSEFIPFIITVLGIAFGDLLIGIGLGLVFGVFQILWHNYKIPFHFDPEKYDETHPVFISMSENVTFLNKASILHVIQEIPDGIPVVFDASNTISIHNDVIEIIDDFIEHAEKIGVKVELRGYRRPGKNIQPAKTFMHFKSTLDDRPE